MLDHLLPTDRALVIGVWGPSGGGKTTVAKWLTSHFSNAAHIAMDDYCYSDRAAIAAAGGTFGSI